MLEAIVRTKSDSSVSQTLEAQKRTFVNTVLLYLRLSDVYGLYTNIKVFVNIVSHTCIQLTTISLNRWETPREARSTSEVILIRPNNEPAGASTALPLEEPRPGVVVHERDHHDARTEDVRGPKRRRKA